jgi:hypothetical protein
MRVLGARHPPVLAAPDGDGRGVVGVLFFHFPEAAFQGDAGGSVGGVGDEVHEVPLIGGGEVDEFVAFGGDSDMFRHAVYAVFVCGLIGWYSMAYVGKSRQIQAICKPCFSGTGNLSQVLASCLSDIVRNPTLRDRFRAGFCRGTRTSMVVIWCLQES